MEVQHQYLTIKEAAELLGVTPQPYVIGIGQAN